MKNYLLIAVAILGMASAQSQFHFQLEMRMVESNEFDGRQFGIGLSYDLTRQDQMIQWGPKIMRFGTSAEGVAKSIEAGLTFMVGGGDFPVVGGADFLSATNSEFFQEFDFVPFMGIRVSKSTYFYGSATVSTREIDIHDRAPVIYSFGVKIIPN